MQVVDQTGGGADLAFRLLRFLVQFLTFFAAVMACRWGMRSFLSNRGRRSNRWRNSSSAVNFVVLVLLLLLRGPAEKLLTVVGDWVGRFMPAAESGWPAATMIGLYYVVVASLILFLAIYAVGLVYRFGDWRIDAWQSRLRAGGVVESNPRFHASRIFRLGIHVFCTVLATALVLVYFLSGFAIFPRTRIFTDGLLKFLGPPFRDVSKAFEDYIPNLGYLFVIVLFGWVLQKILKYFFTSIQRGDIVLADFPVEWAEPTYKLSRTALFLLGLMVSLPYLPGAHSPFFRGFSLFFGALVTFGSSGVIGNLFAGILLTYQRAFRLGDVVRIEGVYGKVIEKTLLITRVVTSGNEHVTIPNSKVLADSVTNFSVHGLSKGFALGITATIGYDVDWRIVQKLLLDGAARTEQIATEPAPRAMVTSFGNYSVEYELRTWTKTSERIFETGAALRQNVLDAFADAGVEIMTPTILSHRDASELAVPAERFPNRSQPAGIRINVDPESRRPAEQA
jgi:small-conductance mechanosensitive channel